MMPPDLSAGQIAMVIVYWLLVFFWFAVVVVTATLPSRQCGFLTLQSHRLIHRAFLVVALILFIDCLYWAITNSARAGILPPELEMALRDPWLVASVKGLVLVSGLLFLVLALSSDRALARHLETTLFSKFVNYSWDAIGVLKPNGCVRFWNRAAVKLFGFSTDYAKDKHINEFLVPADLHQEAQHTLNLVRDTRRARQRCLTERMNADGDRLSIDLTVSPIEDAGEFCGYFGIMRMALPPELRDWSQSRYFRRVTMPQQKPCAFVIMPFAEDIVPANLWEMTIKDAVEAVSLVPVRVDARPVTEKIMDQVFTNILTSTIVIAVLTGKNPNVFYELGIAHALNKHVIQLVRRGEPLPFDVASIWTIDYDPEDLGELRCRLVATLQRLMDAHGLRGSRNSLNLVAND